MRRFLPGLAVALALLLAAGQLGYMCSRSELGDLRADLTLARQTEAELRERLALEARLGAPPSAAPEVDPEAAAASAAAADEAVAAARAEAADAGARAEAAARQLDEAVVQLRRAKQAAEQDRRAFAAARVRLEQERTRLRERVAAAPAPRVTTRPAPEPPPRVAAVQPPAKRAAPPSVAASQAPAKAVEPAAQSCPELEAPKFTLRDIGEFETRLGGRLLLRLEVDGGQLALRIGSGARSRYLLSEPPQRFAFDCAGTAYVVAVCDITNSPLSVSGRVSRAEDWRDACRG